MLQKRRVLMNFCRGISVFSIRSTESDAELVFLSHRGDYFDIELRSRQLSAAREVWAYTDAYGLADLLNF